MRLRSILTLAMLTFLCGSAEATEWLMVGAIEFKPVTPQTEWSHTLGMAYLDARSPVQSLFAPVRLPAGATVTGLWCHAYDRSSTSFVEVELERWDHLSTSSSIQGRTVLSATTSIPLSSGPRTISDSSPDPAYEVIKDWEGLVTTTYFTYHLRFNSEEGCGPLCGVFSCSIGYEL